MNASNVIYLLVGFVSMGVLGTVVWMIRRWLIERDRLKEERESWLRRERQHRQRAEEYAKDLEIRLATEAERKRVNDAIQRLRETPDGTLSDRELSAIMDELISVDPVTVQVTTADITADLEEL